MIRIVVDTNVVVSGALADEGLPASILDLAANRKVLMVVSPDILAEYAEVLRRPRFKLGPAYVNQALSGHSQDQRARHAGPQAFDLARRTR